VVQVRGQFTAARQSSTGQVSTFALVGEAGGTPLNCVVFPESYAEMSNVFGGEFGEPLVGRRVLVKGRVGLYRGEPQIVIRSATQCVVVGQAEARSSASIDAPARTPAPPPAVGAYR
jgi:DNA/RNA endonuclease YhcR with UshA esterase domain